jgi:hypothetical protein
MKLFLIIGLIWVVPQIIWAAPPQKVTGSGEVKIKESYSVAQTGMETETYRIQNLLLKGKIFYMAAKLVNGNLFTEKAVTAKEFSAMKNAILPLTQVPASDLCTKPTTISVLKDGKDSQNKVCSEKEEIMEKITKFDDQVKASLEKN